MNKKLIGMGLGVAMLTLGASQGAEASALLRLSAGGASVSCDTSASFVNAIGGNCAVVEGFAAVAGANLISFTGTVDGWGPGPGGELRVNGNQPGSNVSLGIDINFNVQHQSGTNDLTVDFAENDFSLPTGSPLFLSGSQTANWATSTNTDTNAFQVWGRPDNALTVPGAGVGGSTAITNLCTSNGTPSNSCQSDSPDVSFTRNAGNFALTGREIIHTAVGTAALYTNSVTVTSVPEPASMLLLGTGLLGFARRASRKGRKQTQAI